jgi:hypothetical protein
MHKDSSVDCFVSKIENPLYNEPNVMWAHAYVVVSIKTNTFLLIKHLSSNHNFGTLLFGNKISYIKDVPNILHEIIIIINESSLEYKERIFMKFLVHYRWVGTIYLHGI